MSTWSLTYRKSVLKWQQSDKHFWEFYPQDGGENQSALIWNEITSLSPYVYACGLWVKAGARRCESQLVRVQKRRPQVRPPQKYRFPWANPAPQLKHGSPGPHESLPQSAQPCCTPHTRGDRHACRETRAGKSGALGFRVLKGFF